MFVHFNDSEVKYLSSLFVFLSAENLEVTYENLLRHDFPANPKMFWAFVVVMMRKWKDTASAWKCFRNVNRRMPVGCSPMNPGSVDWDNFFYSYFDNNSSNLSVLSAELNLIEDSLKETK